MPKVFRFTPLDSKYLRGFIFISIIAFLLSLAACSQPQSKTLKLTMSLEEGEWKILREEVFPAFERKYKVRIKSYQIESGQLATKLEALKLAKESEIDIF